jgi:hypothetical protein
MANGDERGIGIDLVMVALQLVGSAETPANSAMRIGSRCDLDLGCDPRAQTQSTSAGSACTGGPADGVEVPDRLGIGADQTGFQVGHVVTGAEIANEALSVA